jgi:hypothetical protein
VEFASPKVWEYDGRQIVVVKTPNGPKAFYRRTGKGGKSSGAQPGDWVPFDGFRSQGVERGYFMKDAYLAEGDLDRWGTEEFRQIGKQLAELDAQGKIPKGEDVGKAWRKIQAHLLRSGVKRTLSMPDEELDELAPK